jgi:hypothetical protein
MAYKQKGCTPVTAKVQKTTKGGMVQQPLLNMGAPVKMKHDKLLPSQDNADAIIRHTDTKPKKKEE